MCQKSTQFQQDYLLQNMVGVGVEQLQTWLIILLFCDATTICQYTTHHVFDDLWVVFNLSGITI